MGILLLGSPPAGFNNGLSQINMNFLSGNGGGGEYPFLNLGLEAAMWSPGSGGSPPFTSANLSSTGMPTAFPSGSINCYTTVELPSQASRSGKYVLKWVGAGTMAPPGDASIFSSSANRIVFTPSSAQQVAVFSINSLPVTSYALVHENDEALYDAGQVFGVKFKARLAEANFGVIRFLNWFNTNISNMTSWATRKPVSYCTYAGDERRASIDCGTSTNSSNDYTVAIPSIHSSDGTTWVNGDAPKDKDTIHLLANVASSSAPRVKVGSSGSFINTLDYKADTFNGFGLNVFHTLVYDAAFAKWLVFGNNGPFGSVGLNNGVPVEIMLQLCTEVRAHLYINIPTLACVSSMTDMVPQLATYLRNNAPSWMIPRFEPPNEWWNTAFFWQQYGVNLSAVYGWSSSPSGNYIGPYGKAASTIGQAVAAAYGVVKANVKSQTKYQTLVGVQTGYGNTIFNTTAYDEVATSAQYVAQNTPQSGYAADAAKDWVTTICCAQYIRPAQQDTSAEITNAINYANTGLQAYPDAFTVTTNDAATLGNFTLDECNNIYGNWKTWAVGMGIMKMCGYEGGYSPDTGFFDFAAIVAATNASNCVLTMNSDNAHAPFWVKDAFTNYANLVGLYIRFDNPLNVPVVGMTGLNGASGQITAISNYTVTTNIDTSAMGTYTSGGSFRVYTDAGFTVPLSTWWNNLRLASKNSSVLQGYTKTNYDNFRGKTGSGFVAEFPSCFQLGGLTPANNVWSVLDDINVTPDPPQWAAFKAYNN